MLWLALGAAGLLVVGPGAPARAASRERLAVLLGLLLFHFYGLFQGMAYIPVIFFLFSVLTGYVTTLDPGPLPPGGAKALRASLLALGVLVLAAALGYAADSGYGASSGPFSVSRPIFPTRPRSSRVSIVPRPGPRASSAGWRGGASSTSRGRRPSACRSRASIPTASASPSWCRCASRAVTSARSSSAGPERWRSDSTSVRRERCG